MLAHLMNQWLRHFFVGAALAACGCASAAGSPVGERKDPAQAKAKLAAVRERIADLTSRVGAELKQRDALNARLREADLEITAKRRRVDQLRADQAAVERHRADLRAELARGQIALQSERGVLAAQVRAAYMIGRQEQLKLLLNQSNPAMLGRTLAYYGYFAQQRSSQIEAIGLQAARLEREAAQIGEQSAELERLAADADREMMSVQRARGERSEALAALSKQVSTGNQELAKLKREEQAVESLVADLARVLQDFPVDQSLGFDRLRGKLPWPVVGRITARYQQAHEASSPGIRWNGIMIESSRGAKVRAPFVGRVVYADWLQGLGLLLIVAHSHGYMTLYGHAEVLYKAVGDPVSPGDVIAALSDAEGAAPQLYFEIREGRRTVDPTAWLRAKP